jgi:hypothetical protein
MYGADAQLIDHLFEMLFAHGKVATRYHVFERTTDAAYSVTVLPEALELITREHGSCGRPSCDRSAIIARYQASLKE